MHKLLKNLINHVGKKGTVLIPTYNYDFPKNKKFDRKKSFSQVGVFGKYLGINFTKNRTFEPVFSHIVFGELEKEILNCNISEAFGGQSIFNLILKNNFKIICFCCSPATMTFIHFIEKMADVDYRYDKYFYSSIKIKNKSFPLKYKYFVGKKSTDYSLKEKNINNLVGNKMIKKKFGRFECSLIASKVLYKLIINKLKINRHFLISK